MCSRSPSRSSVFTPAAARARAISCRRLFAVVSVIGIWLSAFVAWSVVPVPTSLRDDLTQVGREFYRPDRDIPIYLVSAVLATIAGSVLFFLAGRRADTSSTNSSGPQKNIGISKIIDGLVTLLIPGLVLIIDPGDLTEKCFVADGFHHLDYYLMGPLHAWLHGKALGTEAYIQYGSGWVLVFDFLGQFFRIDHQFVLAVMPIFGVFYFASGYVLLRILTGCALWSAAGILACLQFQLFSGTDLPIWASPSSSVLRCPFDICQAISLLSLRKFGWAAAVTAGVFCGFSLLFGTDTGIYVASATALFSFISFVRPSTPTRRRELLILWVMCSAVFLSGLTIVSRGTLLSSEFWSGYYESLLDYGGGFGSLPVSGMLTSPSHALLLLFILCTYSLTISGKLAAILHRTADDRDLVCAWIATVGLGTFLLFVGRSHPYNLFHPIVPACILIVVCIADWQRSSNHVIFGVGRLAESLIPAGAILLLLIVLAGNSGVQYYPSPIVKSVRFLLNRPLPETTQEFQRFRADLQKYRRGFELLEKSNRVLFVGEDPLLWLMEFGRPPMGRYCPAALISARQEDQMLSEFGRLRPQVAYVVAYPSLLGSNVNYFDETWRVFFQNSDVTILVSSEFKAPTLSSE